MADQTSIVLNAEVRIDESKLQQSLNRIEKNFKFNSPFTSANGDLSQFDKSLDQANRRVIAFGSSISLLAAGVKIFKDIVSSTAEVEAAFIDINSIFNLSRESLDKFSKGIFDVARDTSQSFGVAADAAKEFSRQGLSAEETLKRTRDALVLTRLSNLDAAASVNVLTAAVNGFQKSGLNTTDILNKFVAVDQNFAVSVSDLAQGFARAGASASDAGVSVDELIGLITSAQQTTARGGAVIGNALKTIFTRLGRGTIIDDFDALGVKVKDANGNILPAIELLKNFANTYDKLSGSVKRQAAELVGGVYQINVFKAAVQDLSKVNSIYAQSSLIAANAQDQALKRNAALNDSYKSLSEQVGTTNKQIFSNIGGQAFSSIVKPVIKFGLNNPIVDALKDASGEASTYGGVFAQGLLKGIGGALVIGLGPILLAAGANIVKRIAGNVSQTVLLEAGINRNQAQTTQAEKTVEQYVRGNQVLKQQITSFDELNASAAKFSAIISSISNIKLPSIGGLTSANSPLVGKVLNGEVLHNLQVYALRPKILENVAKELNPNVVFPNARSLNGIQKSLYSSVASQYEPERASLKQHLLDSHPGINTGGLTPIPLSALEGTPVAQAEIARLGKEADGLINQAIKDTVDRKLAEIKQQTQINLGNITGLNKFNELERIAPSLAQQERETLGVTGYRASGVVKSRSGLLPSYFGTGSGDLKAFRNEFGGRELTGIEGKAALAGAQAIRANRLSRRANLAFGTSFVAPLLAGAVPQGAAGTTAGKVGGALSGALNGAGIGASIGVFAPEFAPLTIAAGTFIGGMVGALGKLHKSFEELVDEAVENNKKINEEYSAANQIFNLIDDLKNDIKNHAGADVIARKQGEINETFDTHVFDPRIRARLQSAINNPTDTNREQQKIATENLNADDNRKSNNLLNALSSLKDFTKNVKYGEGHLEATGAILGAGGGGYTLKRGAAVGPSDKLASSLVPLVDDPNSLKALQNIVSGKSAQNPLDALTGLLKKKGASQEQIDSLNLTDELAKTFLEKVLDLFQHRDIGGIAGHLPQNLIGVNTANDAKEKKLDPISDLIVANEEQAASIKLNSSAQLRINQGLQQVLLSRPNTNIEKLRLSGGFEIGNINQQADSDRKALLASGKAKLFESLGTYSENPDARNAIDRIDINKPESIDALLQETKGTPDEKRALGGAANDKTIKVLEELKKSLDVLNLTQKKNIEVASILDQQKLDEENNKADPVLAQQDDAAFRDQAQTDLENATIRGDSNEKIRDLTLSVDLLTIELKRRKGDITEIESDAQRGTRLNTNEIDKINQAGHTSLEIARDRAAKFKASPFTSGDQVESTQFDVARLQGQQGDAIGSFKTGFSSVLEKFKKDTDQMADIGKQLADSLSSNLGNAFGDFVTGAKSGKDAFKSFVTSVLSDAARAFASKAVQTLIGAISGSIGSAFSSTPQHGAEGGRFGFASGGLVPSLLMGGEFVVGPNAAKKIGYGTLQKLNRFAEGGYVGGGSGVQDDVPASLPSGSFVLRKSAVQKLGPNYLNALVGGGVQHRDFGGGIWGALIGAVVGGGIGYATGGKKGALIGAGIGAIGGGIYGYKNFGNNTGAGTLTSQAATKAADTRTFENFDSWAGKGGATATSSIGSAAASNLSPIQKALVEAGAAGVLGIASSLVGKTKSPPGAIGNDQVPAYASNIENTQLAYLASAGAGKYPYLQQNPQGGYSLAGFGDAPATRRFAGGGGVNMPIMAGGGSDAPQVSIKIDINNNGSTSSSGTSNNKDGAFGEGFAEKLQKQVRSIVTEELVRQSRSDGILAKGNPLGTRG